MFLPNVILGIVELVDQDESDFILMIPKTATNAFFFINKTYFK